MTRLAERLSAAERSALARNLCNIAANAASGAAFEPVAITSSAEVREWAESRDLRVLPDQGGGLSAAVASAVESVGGGPWMVVLPDLPLVTSASLRTVASAAAERTVVVPSQDGGTNVIASTGLFPFSYGPGSFQRHLAARPDAVVMVHPRLSIDIDSPTQLAAFPQLVTSSTITS